MRNWYLQVKKSLELLDSKDKFKFSLITLVQVSLAIFDLFGVILAGVLGSLFIVGTTNSGIGTRVKIILEHLGLGSLSIHLQTAIVASLLLLVFSMKIVASAYLNWRILKFMSIRSAFLSKDLVSKLLSQPLNQINSKGLQENIYLIGNAAGAISTTLSISSILITDLALCLILTVGLFVVDVILTSITLLFFSCLSYLLYFRFKNRIYQYGLIRTKTNVRANQLIFEMIQGFREIHTSGRKPNLLGEIGTLFEKSGKNEAKIGFIPLINKYVIELSMYLVIFCLSAYKFYVSTSVNAAATLSIFIVAVMRIVPSILRIQQGFMTLRNTEGVNEDVYKLIADLRKVNSSSDPGVLFSQHHGNINHNIKVHDLKFSYGNSEFSLNIANLEIKSGEFIALVGKSGSGKSTLVDLILGVLKPDSGSINIGSITPEEFIKKFPGSAAYVSQNIHIFKGSIRENLIFGLNRSEVSDDLLWNVLEKADLAQYVNQNGLDLDSDIGDRGSSLSGGQKQRLGVARALITKPKLLVLDEFTSALDAQTEHNMVKMLGKLQGETTIVVIAHRLSTVRQAPRLIYMANGSIVASGTFESLKKENMEFSEQVNMSKF